LNTTRTLGIEEAVVSTRRMKYGPWWRTGVLLFEVVPLSKS
jgi:hypothetical protein